MDKLGCYIMPGFIFLIIIFGIWRKVPVFERFIEGAKEGLQSCVTILPTLVGLIMAISMLKASGALDMFACFFAPVAQFFGLPQEVMPLVLMKPVSGSGSTALLAHIFRTSGPDSFAGRVASVMAGSTETTFYCIAVYYGAVHIKKTRHTVAAALAADLTACVFSALAVRIFF